MWNETRSVHRILPLFLNSIHPTRICGKLPKTTKQFMTTTAVELASNVKQYSSNVSMEKSSPQRVTYDIKSFNPPNIRNFVEDPMDISNAGTVLVRLTPFTTKPIIFKYSDDTSQFPPDTVGAFVYFLPRGLRYGTPNYPDTAGGIRFRCVSTYSDGYFLRAKDGLPWHIPMLDIATSEAYGPLCDALLYEGIVTRALVDQCIKIVRNSRPLVPSKTQVLHSLKQRFSIRLDRPVGALWATDGKLAAPIMLNNPWRDNRKSMTAHPLPYTGRVIVRFERLHVDFRDPHRCVTLRVLQIVEPIRCIVPNYDDYLPVPALTRVPDPESPASHLALNVDAFLWRGIRLIYGEP